MKKICQILAISSVALLLSACYNSGTSLDKRNVSRTQDAVTKNAINQNNSITSSAAATASAASKSAATLSGR